MSKTFHFTALLFLTLVSTGIYAQSGRVTETTTEYDKKRLASQTLALDAPVEAVYDIWQDFWEDRYDVDIDRTDKDGSNIAYLAEDLSLSDISSKSFDLYSSVDGTDKVSTVSVSIGYDGDQVATSQNDPTAFRAAADKLMEFRTFFYTRYFDDRIATVRESLEDAKEEQEDASGDAEKARKQIAKYEKKIEDLRRRIEKTREDVGEELEAAESSEARVRELEEELRQLQSSRTNYVG